MSKSQIDLLSLAPLEEYKKPIIPTYKDEKPDLMKKMPARWKNKAIAATAMGLLGTATLSSCVNTTQSDLSNWSVLEDHQYCWMHHGGGGAAPLYVAYLTEQEAIGIIRAELEAVGIEFAENSTSYSIKIDDTEEGGRVHNMEANLVNEEHNIAISIAAPNDFHIPFWRFEMDEIAGQIEAEFAKNHPHLAMGLFCNPSSWVGSWDWYDDEDDAVTDEEKKEARQRLEANLIAQTQEFIQHLREEGIIK